MTLDENAMFEEKLDQIKKAGLYRVMKDLQTPQGPWVRIAGRDLLMLSSNSYLGLCSDDRLKKAAAEAAQRVTVIGAGFIGLEMAEQFIRLGKQVTLVELQNLVDGRRITPARCHPDFGRQR